MVHTPPDGRPVPYTSRPLMGAAMQTFKLPLPIGALFGKGMYMVSKWGSAIVIEPPQSLPGYCRLLPPSSNAPEGRQLAGPLLETIVLKNLIRLAAPVALLKMAPPPAALVFRFESTEALMKGALGPKKALPYSALLRTMSALPRTEAVCD